MFSIVVSNCGSCGQTHVFQRDKNSPYVLKDAFSPVKGQVVVGYRYPGQYDHEIESFWLEYICDESEEMIELHLYG